MLVNYKNIISGISSKADGSMKLPGNDYDFGVVENQKNYFKRQNIDYGAIILASNQHSNNVRIAHKGHLGSCIRNTDGLVTQEKGIYLAITVADCLPIYFFDYKKGVIGIIHAGWKGIADNIISNTIKLMVSAYKSDAENILVYVGPHIKECHFEVQADVDRVFKRFSNAIISKNSKTFISLSRIVITQLIKRGVSENNIEVSQECTYCSSKYFSYRRDKPKILESMITYIGIKE